ncbi:MAG TPA: YidC/Oxa1 family membrane protein insertase [Caulobacteraceae bacterium]|nr:YidC/Oxa1 family membrane protein insertase [Caulobacteraceae bacterium]
MSIVEAVLFPIIWVMTQVLEAVHGVTGSYGLAIIVLSFLVSLALTPLAAISRRAEQREKALNDAMRPGLEEAKAKYKGEKRFNAIEKVYKAHNYHPIMALRSLSGLALQIPFLIAALLLLLDYQPLQGAAFLVIPDLGERDRLIRLGELSVNLLPFLMVAASLLDAWANPLIGREAAVRFAILAVGLFLLVYGLPAAVVLYWTCNNVWSLARTLLRRR